MAPVATESPGIVTEQGRKSGMEHNADGLDRVAQNTQTELGLAEKMGAADVYVDGENDTEWCHWVGSLYIKPIRFDNRSGSFVILLATEPEAQLGKHRHRGEVRAWTVKGPWGYHEYTWTAKAGDYVNEKPGTIHTLWMGAGSEVLFDVSGSIEFFHDNNELRETMDGFSFWRLYVEHCEKKGIEPKKDLWY